MAGRKKSNTATPRTQKTNTQHQDTTKEDINDSERFPTDTAPESDNTQESTNQDTSSSIESTNNNNGSTNPINTQDSNDEDDLIDMLEEEEQTKENEQTFVLFNSRKAHTVKNSKKLVKKKMMKEIVMGLV